MRTVTYLSLILILSFFTGCGGSSIGTPEIMPSWPPDRPIQQQPPVADQETIDWIKFQMMQWHGYDLTISGRSKDELWGGVYAIYLEAVESGDSDALNSVIGAMASVGYVEFLPILLDELEAYGGNHSMALSAVGNMPSEYSIYVLIGYFDHENMHTRDSVAMHLGFFRYYDLFPGTKLRAIRALVLRRKVEQVDWVLESIDQALDFLLGRSQPVSLQPPWIMYY